MKYNTPKKLLPFLSFLFIALFFYKSVNAQGGGNAPNVTGNVESIFQYLRNDSSINAAAPEQKGVLNSYANINYTQGNFKAGMRFESYLPSIAGYPGFYSGTGLGYRFVEYDNSKLSVTAGNFFEQFGSGLAFRSYEERGIGLDNAMDGARIKFSPVKGVHLKAIYGQMRFSFDGRVNLAEGIIRGLDGEISLNETFKFLADKKLKVLVGGSFVSRYQGGNNDTLNLPKNVANYGGRIDLKYGNWYLNGEYIHKINDPTLNAEPQHNYVFNTGHGAIINMGYSQKGLAVLLSAKSIDNMNFRADRTVEGNQVLIGFLPALTKQHTYNLTSTLYPYASVPNGEIAYQLDVLYKIPRKTLLGGKYGMDISLNVAAAFDPIQEESPNNFFRDRVSYIGKPFNMSDSIFIFDFNVELKKKLSKKFKLTASYFHFIFNNDVNPVTKDASGYVYSDIFVLDGAYKISRKHSIRAEIQTLFTQQDKGSWVTGLVEYTISPGWFFAVMNQYNYGNPIIEDRQNYLLGSLGYTFGASRFMASFGRQREGIVCIGGVCRPVPATNGLTFTFTTTF